MEYREILEIRLSLTMALVRHLEKIGGSGTKEELIDFVNKSEKEIWQERSTV